jgi:hypothetical protein
MGNIRKIWKKTDPSQLLIRKAVGDKNYDQLSPYGASMEMQYDAAKAAQKQAEEIEQKDAIPLPDEEELARIRRRRARSGGRDSTTLSGRETLGPG